MAPFRLPPCLLLAAAFNTACRSPGELDSGEFAWATRADAVIYEQDDRVDLSSFSGPPGAGQISASVGSLVLKKYMVRDGSGWRLNGPTLGTTLALCPGQAFLEEPSVAVCTAVVVAPRTIATAGHCFTQVPTSELLFVRDYALVDGHVPTFPETSVSEIDQVLAKIDGNLETSPGEDVGIARLADSVGLGPFFPENARPRTL